MNIITAPTRLIERAVHDLWTFAAINRMHISLVAAAALLTVEMAGPDIPGLWWVVPYALVNPPAVWLRRRAGGLVPNGHVSAIVFLAVVFAWLAIAYTAGWLLGGPTILELFLGESSTLRGVVSSVLYALMAHAMAYPHDVGPGGWLQSKARDAATARSFKPTTTT